MFSYTNDMSRPETTARKPQFQNSDRLRRESPSFGPRRAPSRPAQSDADPLVTPKQNTRTSSRNPVPSTRFQRALEKAREGREPSPVRERVQPATKRSRVKVQPTLSKSQSDIIKLRPLEVQCQERPHSSYQSTVPKAHEKNQTISAEDSADSSLEDKILLAVKEALSRVISQKGDLDEHSKRVIWRNIESCLTLKQKVDNEQGYDGGLEAKNRSRIDTRISSNKLYARESRPLAGLIRKPMTVDSKMRLESTYKNIYNKDEPDTSSNDPGKEVSEEKQVVFIVLPDQDFPELNLILKDHKNKGKDAPDKKLTKQGSRKQSVCTFSTDVVGDSNAKESCRFDTWKPSEDTKLLKYVEGLVRSLKMSRPNEELHDIEDEMDTEPLVCKSFCVCKVCVSNKKRSKDSPLKHESQLKSKYIMTNPSRAARAKPSKRESYVDSHLNVLKKNQHFQPDSRMSITLRQTVDGLMDPTNNGSLNNGEVLKETEEKYLQRRINKSHMKRRMSTT